MLSKVWLLFHVNLISMLILAQAVYLYGIAPCTGGLAFGYVRSLPSIVVTINLIVLLYRIPDP